MDPTCGLVDKIRDLVLGQIWKQLLYLVHYHRNIEQLYGRLDDLICERSSLQHRIDEATNNTDKIEENVLHWLRRVDEISEQVQELHRESEVKLAGGITSCPNPWLRCKVSKRAEAIAQEAVKLYGEGKFVTVSYRVPPQSMPELTKRESKKGIDSRVKIKNQIVEALRNPIFNMIGLCGLGGVGKTTIAKDIEKEEKNQKVFEKVIMATVSREMDIGQIQDQIIEKLGMQLNERTEEVKASRLYERLENEKNMLLILDNLWQELDLGKVGIPFVGSKINEGCKILLTSRNETLLSKSMECQKIITVGVLLDNEARELFQSIAELSIESSSPDLKSIATEIVQKCGGLPLAIATAAKALKGKKEVGVWRDYLARLKHPLGRSFTGIKEVDTILKLSYEPLSQEKKHIFLFSAMLSHDPSIEDLLMYSVGLDILKHTQNMGDARDAIFDIVGKLKSLNLFLDSFSSHHFTMHDVFRDVALSMASEELNAVIVWHRSFNEWPDESDLKCCKGICFQESDICDLPEELHGPILEFFLLNSKKSDLTIPDMFFNSSKELKVLAITNVHFSSLPSLSFLRRLKALCLHSCLLQDITEIRSLRTLKVLSLTYSEIEWLPIELAELTSLQMLNLSHCSYLKEIPQKLLSSLKKLEVLYMGNSFHQWKVEGSSEANENASLDELKNLPISSLDIHIPNVSMLPENLFLDMNLKRYKISIKKQWKWQENYETSKILKLELQSSVHLKLGIRKLLEGVEDLHLYGSNAHEIVLHSHEEREFPHLMYLRIDGNHEAATKNAYNKTFKSFFNKKVLFPKLEILELCSLNSLIPLMWDDQLSHNSFSNLKTLMVKSCGFVKLVPLHVLKSLNKLEELEVKDCDMLEIVFDFEDLKDDREMESSSVVVPLKKLKLVYLPKLKNVFSNTGQGDRHAVSADLCVKDRATNNTSNEISKSLFNNKVLLPMLEILELSDLFNRLIPLIWDDQLSQNLFNNLKVLVVERCGFVKLVPLHVLKSLNKLEEVEVKNCDMLEIVFDFEDVNDYYKKGDSSSVVVPLKKLKLWDLPKLKNVWSNNYQENISFPSLRSIHVSDCKSLASIFPALSIAKGMLEELEELQISGCSIDVIVAKDQVSESVGAVLQFPGLTSLKLHRLSQLTNFYPQRHTVEWPHLQRLSIQNCDELEIFETEVSSSSEIYEEDSALNSKYPLFSHDKVIHNLEELDLGGKPAKMIGSGQFPMYHFPKVKLLRLYAKNATAILYRTLLKSFPKLEELKLSGHFAEAFGGDDVAALASPFPKLTLDFITITRSLSPLLVSLPNLTHIEVISCFDLTTLMSSSTGRSLVHLTRLTIGHCTKIKEIITKQEGENDEDKEIVFDKLKILVLHDLCRLKRFCGYNYNFRFPSLDQLVIEKCPLFKRFSPRLVDTPCGESIQLSQDGEKQHEAWDADLNKRFYQQRLMALREVVLDEEDAIIIRNGQFPAACCPQVEILGIEGFVEEGVTFPYTLLKKFPKLNELHVKKSSFEEIFPSHSHIVDQIPPFKELSLVNLHQLKNIWKDDSQLRPIRNPQILHVENCSNLIKLAPSSTSFVNLTELKVSKCHQLIYLVTCSTAKSLVNLKTLEIDDCKKMEEIVTKETNEDVEGEITFNGLRKLRLSRLPRLKIQEDKQDFNIEDRATNTGCTNIPISLFSQNKVLFPKLEILELSNLNSLIALIWDDQLSHNSFSNLKRLMVEVCFFVKLVPLHVLKSLNKLEELEVRLCNMLEIVFDFENLKDDKEMESSSSVVVPMKELRLCALPKLKNVWSNHHQGNVSFPSLRSVYVWKCESLTSIFPTSIAKGMLCDLEELQIERCGIDVIVAKDQVLESAAVTFEFPSLTSLHLSDLQKLRNFFPLQHTLKLPQLHRLSIRGCDEFEIFEKEISSSSEIHEEESTLNSKHPLFSHHDQVIEALEELRLWGKEAEMIGSGQFPMYHFPNVKLLSLSAKKATTISYRSLLKSFTKLEGLQLKGNFEKAFGGKDVAGISKLTLSHNSIMGSLSSSLVSSPNLTHLNVHGCHEWTTLITSSIARSLVHLTCLSVRYCNKMEEIITKQEGEDGDVKEIFFRKLESFELADLPELRRFCRHNYTFRFPLLVTFVIRRCLKFTRFSPGHVDTPSLKIVQLSQDYWREKRENWGTNLDKTFYQLRYVASKEMVLDEDDAIMIRNDQFPADRCPHVEILGIEGFVEEGVTFPYTLLKKFPKLNELHVKKSSFEEIFPSHSHIVDQIPPFKELSLVNLHQLKNIWKDDSQLRPIQNLQILHVENCSNLIKLAPSSTSFDNLTELKVSECHQLIYFVTGSTAKSLVNLETLEIDDCEKLEEIIKKEPNEDVESGITFNQLQKIKLTDTPSLKMFSLQSHTFKFPELEKIKITGCPEMKMFCQGVLETPKLSKVKIEEHDMEWKDGDLNKTLEMLSSAN